MSSRALAGLAVFLLASAPALALDLDTPGVGDFIESMVRDYDYDRDKLDEILGQAEIKRAIIDLISKPAEKTLNWADYRAIFMTRERIRAGAEFWAEHRAALECVSAETGVPVDVVVGIIGVETYFGRVTGGHRVLDALATLAFAYPPRAEFFRGELKHFLLLVREEDMQATEAYGSYAGAMGRPQFMPSSYRAYAVDATGDGKRDIWNDWTDVAGSISNYLVEHGWKPGEQVAVQATLGRAWRGPVPANVLQPEETVQSLSDEGVMFATDMPAGSPGQLLTFEGKGGDERWVAFHNFFVITRYNHSAMYALVVEQLGHEVRLQVELDAS